MTGEITLRGKVLPVGGVRDKLMAARRAGLTDVVLPASNRKDLVEVPQRLRRSLRIHLVDSMQQVMELVLLPPANGHLPSSTDSQGDSSGKPAAIEEDVR